jgi:hypothetical protein
MQNTKTNHLDFSSKLVFEIFNKEKHDREIFDCGNAELNNYLKKLAFQQHTKNLNRLYVATLESVNTIKSILGFYTLSGNSISFSAFPKETSKKIPNSYPIPTIKIGRLARDLNLTPSGFGKTILADALYRCLSIAKDLGVFAVEIEAKNEKLKGFYKKLGFTEFIDNKLALFIPIATLALAFNKTDNKTETDKKETEKFSALTPALDSLEH